jgi:hypothetical protein
MNSLYIHSISETSIRSLSTPEAIAHLLSHLYVHRAAPAWKDKDHSTWFRKTILAAFSSLTPSSPTLPTTSHRATFNAMYTTSSTLRYSVYRHLVVLEPLDPGMRKLFSFTPSSEDLNSIMTREKSLACDPLPPKVGARVSAYDEAFFEGVGEEEFIVRRSRREEEAILARAIPDAGIRDQLRVCNLFFFSLSFLFLSAFVR